MSNEGRYRPVVLVSVFFMFLVLALVFSTSVPTELLSSDEIDPEDISVEGLLYETAVADHYTQGYCQIIPCGFPEGDANEPRDPRRLGGFVFGADYVTGHDGKAENLYYPHTDEHDGFEWQSSGGIGNSAYEDRTAEIGMDNVTAFNPVFYRRGIDDGGDIYDIKLEARSARISHNGRSCADAQYSESGGQNAEPPSSDHYEECDVYMWTPELAFKYVEAVSTGLTFTMEEYWVVSPEDDWCRTSLVQTCLATAGDNNANAEMTRGYIRGYWFLLNDQVTLNDANFRIDEGGESFPLEWTCDDRASDHEHNRNNLPGCY